MQKITELEVKSVAFKIIYHFELRTLKPKCAQLNTYQQNDGRGRY